MPVLNACNARDFVTSSSRARHVALPRLSPAERLGGRQGCPSSSSSSGQTTTITRVAYQDFTADRGRPLQVFPVEAVERPPLFVSFSGGGIYFFWQLGAVKYLREHYDIKRVPMAGASSGSIVACLSACGVCPMRTLDAAYALSLENDIWNRKLGLLGIWGSLIRQWLDELLPPNAHEIATDRLHVIIAKAPTLELFEVSKFESKADLIEAVMASSHVPFFLDGKPFIRFRDRLCWDGSFPDFVYFDNSEYLKRNNSALIVDYSMDEELDWQRGDFLKLRSYEETLELIDKGYNYVKRLHESGAICEKFDTAPFRAVKH